MKIEIQIKNDVLLDVLQRANFAYWGKYGPNVTTTDLTKMLKDGEAVRVVRIIEVDERTEEETLHFLNAAKIQKAIGIMVKKYPHKLAEILDESATDMYTGDFLIQLAIFGEEKYA